MGKVVLDLIRQSGLPTVFAVGNATEIGISAPDLRHGDAVRSYVRSLSGFQKEAYVTSAKTGSTWRLVSDEGAYLNGYDAAPCPLAFMSCGMAASFTNEIEALARRDGVEIRKLRLTLDNYYTMTGSMPKRTMVGGAEAPDILIEIDCDLTGDALQSFLINAIYAAPLAGLLRKETPSFFKLARNGEPLSCPQVKELDGAMLADPGQDTHAPEIVESHAEFIEPIGVTPRKSVAMGTGAAASSLAAEQNRRLNIGAVVNLRPDGIKDIQQMQYSPHGTSFRFLSSEDGRAPDANTLISAGIGFCFMTQFGRFVSMLKLDLPEYRIVQDTHFSLGGASGGYSQPGHMDPIETHVFLETTETEAVAQEMLLVSEQTCFLHALCRTALKPRLQVTKL